MIFSLCIKLGELYLTRRCNTRLDKGQLVFIHSHTTQSKIGVVANCTELSYPVISIDPIDAVIQPESPDSIVENEYGFVRIYNWSPPEGIEATYWVHGSDKIEFTKFSEAQANLQRAFTEKFFDRAERSF